MINKFCGRRLLNWEEENMNELENIDNINIDDLYNRIVTLIENAKIQLEQRKNVEDNNK